METSPSTKCFQLDLFLEEKTVNKIFLNIARARIDSGSQKASREFKKHFFQKWNRAVPSRTRGLYIKKIQKLFVCRTNLESLGLGSRLVLHLVYIHPRGVREGTDLFHFLKKVPPGSECSLKNIAMENTDKQLDQQKLQCNWWGWKILLSKFCTLLLLLLLLLCRIKDQTKLFAFIEIQTLNFLSMKSLSGRNIFSFRFAGNNFSLFVPVLFAPRGADGLAKRWN